MTRTDSQRPKFTLMQLFVAVTVIAVLLAIGTQWIRSARETGRRTQCSGNMKSLLLAVHNYHDVNNELPPLATGPRHWSWIERIRSFMETSTTWPAVDVHRPATAVKNVAVVRGAIHRSGWLCPTRRTKAARISGMFKGGQPTDYVAVSSSTSLNWSPKSDGMIVYRLVPPTATSPAQSATRFNSVTDGISNTAMIGEKHMRPAWLGGKWDEPALVAIEDPNTIRVATDRLRKGLARGFADSDPWRFGSWHNKVVLFGMGDGYVRTVSVDTDPKILRLMSCRNDGQRFELP